MDGELLTVDELANVLKVPISWVYSRTRVKGSGAMPVIRCGKYRRFRLPDVLKYLEKQDND